MTVRGWKRPTVNIPPRDAQASQKFEELVLPNSGLTAAPSILAASSALINPVAMRGLTYDGGVVIPADSYNVWVVDGKLQRRPVIKELFAANDNTFGGGPPNGAFTYWDLDGTRNAVVTSCDSVYHLDTTNLQYTPLTYVSGTSNLPPSGGDSDTFFGDTVYLPRTDENLVAFTNGVDPIFVWGGPSSGTGYSTLTQAPICRDLINFNNRPVAWNIRELSSVSRYITRVQWPAAGDPEDWNVASIGAGYEDLLDAKGEGTRIFALEDELLLATTEELWRGRRVGLPFVFQFSPITKTQGIPYPRAALQTPIGIVWLGADYHIYRYAGGRLDVLDGAIYNYLSRAIKNPSRAFFSYDPKFLRLSFFCCLRTTSGTHEYPMSCFTYHVVDNAWTFQLLGAGGIGGGLYQWSAAVPVQRSDPSAATWGDLTGTVASQVGSYEDLLYASQSSAGPDGRPEEVLLSARRTGGGASISTGLPCYFDDRSLQTEVGQGWPNGVYWAASFGPVFPAQAIRERKYVKELRFDFFSTYSSCISVYLLADDDRTATSASSGLITLSAATSAPSATSPADQTSLVTVDSYGTYFRVVLKNASGNEKGDWQLLRYYVRGETEGRP